MNLINVYNCWFLYYALWKNNNFWCIVALFVLTTCIKTLFVVCSFQEGTCLFQWLMNTDKITKNPAYSVYWVQVNVAHSRLSLHLFCEIVEGGENLQLVSYLSKCQAYLWQFEIPCKPNSKKDFDNNFAGSCKL